MWTDARDRADQTSEMRPRLASMANRGTRTRPHPRFDQRCSAARTERPFPRQIRSLWMFVRSASFAFTLPFDWHSGVA